MKVKLEVNIPDKNLCCGPFGVNSCIFLKWVSEYHCIYFNKQLGSPIKCKECLELGEGKCAQKEKTV